MSASTGASKETAGAATGAATASNLATDADAPTPLFVTAVVAIRFVVTAPANNMLPPVITPVFVNIVSCTGIARITGIPQTG
jgi:hypothetical protein